MAIEITNSFEAAGWFDGGDPPFNDNPIFSSQGIQPFDPATTLEAPLGGFTRLGTSAYLIKLVRPIDVLESICMVTCFPTAAKLGRLCGSVVQQGGGLSPPVGDLIPDTDVLVLGDFSGDDDFFQLGVFRFLSDLSGTQLLPGSG